MLFLLCSFEGPDRYSQAGGLGVRIAELSRALAENGHETHLYFIGDPNKPAEEHLLGNKLIYHRWCQWISRYHPHGVYDGEEGKLQDYTVSLPKALIDNYIIPALSRGRSIVVMAEEWHTVPMLLSLSELLKEAGIRDKVVILWNANNIFGFDRIPWNKLVQECTITTVSRFMKHLMWSEGVDPLVIPNGIPTYWCKNISKKSLDSFSVLLENRLSMAKVGRFDPDKRWLMAVESVALLKQHNLAPLLIFRGGMEPHGQEVRNRAKLLDLRIEQVHWERLSTVEQCLEALKPAILSGAELIELASFMPIEFMRLLYHGVDAVLAASGREPFGLVGLEVMGSGGLAVTGSTGEDYAIPYQNAIVIETDKPEELAHGLELIKNSSELAASLRKEGKQTAKNFQWGKVINILMEKISFAAFLQNVKFTDKRTENFK